MVAEDVDVSRARESFRKGHSFTEVVHEGCMEELAVCFPIDGSCFGQGREGDAHFI